MSKDFIRIAPGWDNAEELTPFHLIHPDLFIYRNFWMVKTTFDLSDGDPIVGGDRRLGRPTRGKASWEGPHITQRALAAFLTFIEFVDLDCLVTIRTWDRFRFSNWNATLQYLPPADLYSNRCDVPGFLFDFKDVKAL